MAGGGNHEEIGWEGGESAVAGPPRKEGGGEEGGCIQGSFTIGGASFVDEGIKVGMPQSIN